MREPNERRSSTHLIIVLYSLKKKEKRKGKGVHLRPGQFKGCWKRWVAKWSVIESGWSVTRCWTCWSLIADWRASPPDSLSEQLERSDVSSRVRRGYHAKLCGIVVSKMAALQTYTSKHYATPSSVKITYRGSWASVLAKIQIIVINK